MKEPDFSSSAFHGAVQDELERIVAKWAMRVLIWIVVAIFGSLMTIIAAAIWADRIYVEIKTLGTSMTRQEAATDRRIGEWNIWRTEVDAHFRTIDNRTSDRWTRSAQRDYNAQLGYLNPGIKTPDPDAIIQRLSSP